MKAHIDSLEQTVQVNQTTDRTNATTRTDISREVVIRHLNAFLNNNLDALLSDYTNESVLITHDATYSSLEEIRAFFEGLNMHFPKQNSTLILDKIAASNDLVYIVWHAKTPSLQVPIGSDTFIIRDGKIHQQTFAGQMNFIDSMG